MPKPLYLISAAVMNEQTGEIDHTVPTDLKSVNCDCEAEAMLEKVQRKNPQVRWAASKVWCTHEMDDADFKAFSDMLWQLCGSDN